MIVTAGLCTKYSYMYLVYLVYTCVSPIWTEAIKWHFYGKALKVNVALGHTDSFEGTKLL